MILDEVRAHVLAGRTLPNVWVPDHQTRDDREIVRLRLEVATQRTRLKNQIRNLVKRSRLGFPDDFTSSGDWSKRSVEWLREVAAGSTGGVARGGADRVGEPGGALPGAVRADPGPRSGDHTPEPDRTLCSAISQTEAPLRSGDADGDGLPDGIGRLGPVRESSAVGRLFGAGPVGLRVGGAGGSQGAHHQARSVRVRHVLCQAAWAALRVSPEWRAKYDRIRRGSKSRGRIAIVAVMRQLGVEMWHTARSPELGTLLDEHDALASEKTKKETSARAPQKGAAPSTSPSPRPRRGEAEATATRKGLARRPG